MKSLDSYAGDEIEIVSEEGEEVQFGLAVRALEVVEPISSEILVETVTYSLTQLGQILLLFVPTQQVSASATLHLIGISVSS